ncbi:MAG: acetyl-CoA carboxylase biotin carboxyl carrier protein subunit [Ferruginibacter sp.]
MNDSNKDFKVKANDFVFYFDKSEIADADLVQKSVTEFNFIKEYRSINAVLVEADTYNKKFKISIEGEIFLIEIKDELDQMLEIMGFGLAVNKQLTNIKAPMPGLVLEIDVTEGQLVNAGDKILILEAMKMENSIMIPASATIKKILVSKGQAVDRGQVLVELSPL